MKHVATVAVCLALASCGPEATDEPDAPTEPLEWSVVQSDMDGSILSFWGPSLSSLWAVGGALDRDGGQAFILHHDGESWWEVTVDAPALWWVYGLRDDDVWAVGERGIILHFDGESWERVAGGEEDYTLWGLWGPSSDQLWAVGGDIDGDRPSVMLEYDGDAWTELPDIGIEGELLFKVWGSDADHAFAIGTGGAVLRWDGVDWTRTNAGTDARLVTVHGRAFDDVYVVGGLGDNILMHFDGVEWTSIEVEPTGGLMGVWADPSGVVVATGFRGTALLGPGEQWTTMDPDTLECLHAVWGDGEGTFLAGGGNLLTGGAARGVITAVGDVNGGAIQPWPDSE